MHYDGFLMMEIKYLILTLYIYICIQSYIYTYIYILLHFTEENYIDHQKIFLTNKSAILADILISEHLRLKSTFY